MLQRVPKKVSHYLKYLKQFPKKFFSQKKFSIKCFKKWDKKVQENSTKKSAKKSAQKSLVTFKSTQNSAQKSFFPQKSSQFSAFKSVPKKLTKKVQN